MPNITNRTEIINQPGDFCLKVTSNGGTATLQWNVDNEGFEDVVDGSYSIDASDVITLPECQITAVCTGGATVNLNRTYSR